MINFIIYEKNIKKKDLYELTILNFIGTRDDKFRIINYEDYKDNNPFCIYIISTEKITKALNMAKKVRSESFESPIIIITNLDNIKKELLINNLLILDYIDNKKDIANKLRIDLNIAYKMLTRKKSFIYNYNGEITKIPYDNILYIEKNNNQNYCAIYTTCGKYKIKETINNLEVKLDSIYFMKTHRSCLVNIYNIKKYNINKNTIQFIDNTTTDLVARDKKQILKHKLIEEKNIPN